MVWLMLLPILLSIIIFLVRVKPESICGTDQTLPITVVIAARNEADFLPDLLRNLKEEGFCEIIVADDHSTDATLRLSEECGAVVVSLTDTHGKKAAITAAINHAKGEFILQLDADVSLPEGFGGGIATVVGKNMDLVVLPVRIENQTTFLGEMQRIEQGMLQWVSYFFASEGRPILANGANMLYKRSAFMDLSGFAGNEQWASGDDQFLLRKMIDAGKRVDHVLHDSVTVDVRPALDWSAFFSQRLRWAGKMTGVWNGLQLFLGATALVLVWLPLIFLSHLLQQGLYGYDWLLLLPVLLWYGSHIFMLRSINSILGTSTPPITVIIASIFFALYAPVCAILSIFVRPRWKGRVI
jgi:cellulose synthase/poly-beta-1,6-N-acetylglucosamine synthase-like glycosyltransferase